jgi:hypothetical protein
MGLYDSFYASLTRPHYGCQASVEAQTQGVENAMLTFGIGEPVESLAQANFRGFAGCRWCDASVEVPILVREGRFIGFGGPALMSPAFGQLHFDQLPCVSVTARQAIGDLLGSVSYRTISVCQTVSG